MASKAVAATVVSAAEKMDPFLVGARVEGFVTSDLGLPQDFARIYTSLGLGKGQCSAFLAGG